MPISPHEVRKKMFTFIFRMGSTRGTLVVCTARSRCTCMRIDAAERRSGEGWSPSIDSRQGLSVPSAVMV